MQYLPLYKPCSALRLLNFDNGKMDPSASLGFRHAEARNRPYVGHRHDAYHDDVYRKTTRTSDKTTTILQFHSYFSHIITRFLVSPLLICFRMEAHSGLPNSKNARALLQPDTSSINLILTELPIPTPDPNSTEHLIRVHVIAPCNGERLWPKNFPPPDPTSKEWIPCYDMAGTVIIAPPSSPLPVGSEVYARTNYRRAGCDRDFTIALTEELALRPRNLSWIVSVAVPLSAQTAWQALFVHAGLQGTSAGQAAGTRILVTATSGGVGAWLVQLASLAGAEVVGTCGPDNVEMVKTFGASTVINYRTTSLCEWGQEPQNQVDIAIDCIGRSSLEDAWWAVRDGGILISIAQPPEQVRPEECKGKDVKDMFFIMEPNAGHLSQITQLVEEGNCRPIVDSVWGFEEYDKAFERADSGRARGKVVIDMGVTYGR